MGKIKILRITTVPISLNILLKGQLKYVQENDFLVFTASANGSEVSELTQREGVEHFKVPLTRAFTPLQDIVALVKLIQLIVKLRPQIVHTHTPKAGLLGMMAAFFCRVPVRMHTVAGLPLMESKGIMRVILTATERITYFCAKSVYPNSLNLKNWIVSNISTDEKKLKVIGKGSTNGIDSAYFSRGESIVLKANAIRKELGIGTKNVVHLFVGRLVNDKGINELIEAFVKLNDDSHLLLVGSFENERDAVPESTRKQITMHPKIHAVGFQPDVRPYFAAADIFVFPSYREGFPNVVLQACSMSLPCIVSNINGCNEIIKDKETGVIVSVKSVHELYEAMKKLSLSEDDRKAIAEKARVNVIKNFEQSYVWNQLLNEYKKNIQWYINR